MCLVDACAVNDDVGEDLLVHPTHLEEVALHQREELLYWLGDVNGLGALALNAPERVRRVQRGHEIAVHGVVVDGCEGEL